MAQDATGAATTPDNIPTYNTAVDNPSGKGSNAQMTAIQTALSARVSAPAGVAIGEGAVWNGTTWVRSSATKLASGNFGPVVNADVDPAAAIAYSKMNNPGGTTTFLRADGTFAVPTGATPTTDHFLARPLVPYTTGNNTISVVANTATGIRFYLPVQVSITNLYHSIIVQSGNYDFGIYDTSFNAVWRYGSHTVPVASTSVAITVAVSAGSPVTSPLVLNAGYYYLVSAADNVIAQTAVLLPTGNGTSANRAGVSGVAALDAKPLVFTKAASFPLTSTIATPTAWDYTSNIAGSMIVEGV